MELNVEDVGNNTVRVQLVGRLDTVGVDQVETRFGAAVASSGCDAVIDLSGVTFVSSMGVRLLITAARSQRVRGHRMVLCAAQPGVEETLQMVALDQIIPIAPSEAAALALLAQPAS